MAIGFPDMKLLIGIPAYNEAQAIGKVIRSLPKKISGFKKLDVLVVDDGSIDDTAQIVKREKVRVLSHIINRGLGGALKSLFAYARENDYDVLVTFDADGQHLAGDIVKIVKPILNKKKDVVIGTRWKNRNAVPWSRYLVNQIANLLTLILFGIYTSDSQSGLRAFNRKAILKINVTTDGMEVSSEFFKEIKMNNLRLDEVPINPIYTDYSKKKGQRLDNAPEVFLRLLIKFIR